LSGAFLVIATLAAGVLVFLLAVFAYAVVFGQLGDGPDSPFVTAVVGSFAVAFIAAVVGLHIGTGGRSDPN